MNRGHDPRRDRRAARTKKRLARTDRAELLALLTRHDGSVLRAAMEVRVTRQSLYNHVDLHDLRAELRALVEGRPVRVRVVPEKKPARSRNVLAPLTDARHSEVDVLRDLLERHCGNVSAVARELGCKKRLVWEHVMRNELVSFARALREAARRTYVL